MTGEFKKQDAEKLDLTLAPPQLTFHYTAVGTFGEQKYGRNNWKKAKTEDVKRYYAAMLRHQNAELLGEYYDLESGLPHGWHALWNRAAINYFVEKYGHKAIFNEIHGENE